MKKLTIVTTSWDDGHKLDLKLAKLLKKYRLKGTFYIAPQNREFGKADLLTDKEIIKLSHSFEIGCHTLTHPQLTKLNGKNASKEITDSKKYLEKLIKKPIKSFCYPRGNYSKKVKNMVKKACFTCARTTAQMITRPKNDYLELGTTIQAFPLSIRAVGGEIKYALKNNPNLLPYLFTKNWAEIAKKTFDYVQKAGGVYHLWGHSWMIEKYGEWQKLEQVLAYLSNKSDVLYLTNSEVARDTRKLKIIQTPGRFHPAVGGVEKYVLDLSKQLIKLCHKVKVICANEPKSDVKNIEGIEIERLSYYGKIANTNLTLNLLFRLLKEDFNIIHTYLPTPWSLDFSVLIAKIRKKPVIITYCNDIYGDNWLTKTVAKIYNSTVLKFSLKLADKIIIIQPNYIKYSKYLKKFKKKILFIPPGVSLDKFKINNSKKGKNTLFFLSVLDKYHKYKGLDYLLRAILIVKKKIPNIKLFVGGKGKPVGEYKALVESLGLKENIQFLGFISDEKLNEYYNKSQIFVLPSIGYEEGFGIVLLEAMVCKIPVIATNIVGVAKEVRQNNCGIILKPRNSRALANAIIRILQNPKLAKKMGENGRKLVEEKYNWEKIAKKIEKIYRESIK